MGDRRERVILDADDNLTPALLRTAGAAKLADREVDKLNRDARSTGRSLNQAGRGSRSLDDVESSARRAERSSSLLGDTVVGLGPAFVGIGALAVPALAGISAQLGFVAAGAGVTLLAFHGLADGLKALDAYQLEPTAANLQKLHEAMYKLGPDGQAFVHQLDRLEPSLKQLKVAAESGLLPGVGDALDTLMTRLPQARRLVSEISDIGGDLAREGAHGLTGGGFSDFFAYLEDEARPILTDIGRSVGDLTLGIAHLFTSTAPMQEDFSGWLLGVSRDFEHWTDGLENSRGLESFMQYLHDTGPDVAHALGAIANAVVQVAEAAGPLGGPTLHVLTAVADVIARIADSPVGTPLVALASGLALINRALATTALARNSLVSDLLYGKQLTTGGRGPNAVAQLRSQVQGLGRDIRTANSLPGITRRFGLPTAAEIDAQAAASGRLRSRLGNLGKGAALVGGLALATSGLADKFQLADTASYAMVGTIAGPWGAAIGAGIGLVNDFSNANQKLSAQLLDTDRFLNSGTATVAQLQAKRQQLREQSADLGFLDRLLAGRKRIGWEIDQVSGAIDDLQNKAGSGRGVGTLLVQGLGGPLNRVAADFDTADAAAGRFYDTLGKYSAALDLRAALRAQDQAIRDFYKTLKQEPKGTGGRKGRDDRNAALDNYGRASLAVAQQTKNPVVQTRRLAQARQEFIQLAVAMGKTPPEARKLATSIGLIDRRASAAAKGAKKVGDDTAAGMRSAKKSTDNASDAVHDFGDYFHSLSGKPAKPKVALAADAAFSSLTLFGKRLTATDKRRVAPWVKVRDQATPTLVNIFGWLRSLHDKTVTVRTNRIGTTGDGGNDMAKPHRAGGGPTRAGTIYEVNERGQELWSADRDGYITSNDNMRTAIANANALRYAAQAMGRAGGGSPVHVHVTPNLKDAVVRLHPDSDLVTISDIRWEIGAAAAGDASMATAKRAMTAPPLPDGWETT